MECELCGIGKAVTTIERYDTNWEVCNPCSQLASFEDEEDE